MSEREQIQNDLVSFLEESGRFNAPYGILPGMRPYAKGQIRTIAFGVSRYFDGEIQIISPKCITVSGQGGLTYKYCGKFDSVQQLKDKFNDRPTTVS